LLLTVFASLALSAGCLPMGVARDQADALMAIPVDAAPQVASTEAAATAASAGQAAANETRSPAPSPSPETDALRFVFPTPAPAPKSAWRPPLYPVPWALSPYDHFYFNRPIAADEVNWPLADYRYGGVFFGSDNIHTGIDIDAPFNTPVLAAAPGTVVWAGYGLSTGAFDSKDPYGLAVSLRHDFGYNGARLYTVYAHMSSVSVKVGQTVQAGDQLGLVGNTGFTTGPHLHFEVRLKENDYFSTRNPELWLAPPQGWGVLVGRVMGTNGLPLENQQVLVKTKSGSQEWLVRTYAGLTVHSDDYYQENMVLSDLPAGEYTIWIAYNYGVYNYNVKINPGQITYFTFRGRYLYNTKLPPPPGSNSIPIP
jgi:murein DD-endopeptidase MepM/ murein hydrolase activator NlpD